MRSDSRLSLALHVLLHMTELEGAVTSEELGPRLGVNPVVLRRALAGLRDAGIVRSEKGHGGGWTVARDLARVTLCDVHDAIATTALFGIGHRDVETACPIEQAVNRALGGALAAATEAFEARLRAVTVADLLAGARRGLARRAARPGLGSHAKRGPAHA